MAAVDLLVVEVSRNHITDERMRHGARLLRWRPDKAPESSTHGSESRNTTTGACTGRSDIAAPNSSKRRTPVRRSKPQPDHLPPRGPTPIWAPDPTPADSVWVRIVRVGDGGSRRRT